MVQAGRDIRFSTFYIAGPGLLDVSAGRDLYMADKGELRSLGAVANVAPGDRSSGASIAASAGSMATILTGLGRLDAPVSVELLDKMRDLIVQQLKGFNFIS